MKLLTVAFILFSFILFPLLGMAQVPSKKFEKNTKEYWQKRIWDAQEKSAIANRELAEVQKSQKTNLLSGSAEQKRRADLAQEEKNLQMKIEILEEELNVAIPNEAKRAGVPPAWLRQRPEDFKVDTVLQKKQKKRAIKQEKALDAMESGDFSSSQ